MVYAYDETINLPVKDLYDSLIMLASINAAKDMYLKGEQAIKDFNKEYGDFITPIQNDQDWYNRNVIDKVQNEINRMYERGIDPTRSSEGRAAVLRLINSIPRGTINELKASIPIAKEYLKSQQKLQAEGLYDADYQRWINGGKLLDDWDTARDGVWDKIAANPYQNLSDYTDPYYKHIQPISSTWTDKNGIQYKRKAITEKNLEDVADKNFADLIASPRGQYIYDMLLKKTGDATEAKNAFIKEIAGSQTERLRDESSIDEDWFKLKELQIAKEKLAIARAEAAAKANGSDGTNKMTIFDFARQSPHGKAVYLSEDGTSIHGITPTRGNWTAETITVNSGGNQTKKDDPNSQSKRSSTSRTITIYNTDDVRNGGVYMMDGSGKFVPVKGSKFRANNYTVESSGELIYRNINGRDRFFIKGKLKGSYKNKKKNTSESKIFKSVYGGENFYLDVTETRGVNTKKDKYNYSVYD